ncbi:MAG: GNAT family N-acetyltransferase [Oscillatoriaceae cyanobacterium Prado104]|nr:GNAT family N-acetyltransferase [Oscillatoriaceae cyanobacterium Prado104]
MVYIRALATAPWNRPAITNSPTYKGVGGNLIDFAIARSEELGYRGRIGLHALPGALTFYRKLRVGLLDCGPDPEEPDNLNYFETLRTDR